MKYIDKRIIYSPSDLSNFIQCKHLSHLNKEALDGKRARPNYTNKVMLALREKGQNFEAEVLAQYAATGKSIFIVEPGDPLAFKKTMQAMHQAYDVIYQARLGKEEEWQGWADFLVKVDETSSLGAYSYQVVDTKLATETKAATIIQISLYSEAVGEIQKKMPELMWVMTPDGNESYRVDDYLAYVRLIKRRFLEAIKVTEETTYPDPVPHCDICVWWEICNQKRRADDHLSFVAGMGNAQIKEVMSHGIETLEDYAVLKSPVSFIPNRGAIHTYQKLRDQANIQWRSRNENHRPIYELLEVEPERGFCKLPEPTDHDVYLDLEGDPLVEPGGLEYLVGWYYQQNYYEVWSKNEAEEKQAYKNFMMRIMEIKKIEPGMHIYHYAPYEVTAFKRLAGKYAIQQEELDMLLRSGSFIDLYGVVRQSLRASVEKYSIKDLEKFFGYTREIDLREVSRHKSMYEFLLETNKTGEATAEMKEAIRLYNLDDCISTQRLHIWLEQLRQQCIDKGCDISRPETKAMEPGENTTAHQERIKPLMEALLANVPINRVERTPEQQGKYLLAHMLDWYRREKKSFWWEYFRLMELGEDELLDEKNALSKLTYTGSRSPVKRSVIDTYSFEPQDSDIRAGKKLKDQEGKGMGEVIEIDFTNRRIKIKKGPSILDKHPTAVLLLEEFPFEVKELAIISLAEWVIENGLNSKLPDYKAARELLLRNQPDAALFNDTIDDLRDNAIAWSSALQHSYLPIQGPPGAGKSFTASHMIMHLIKKGKKIGVTALSHKVITNLLEKVWELAEKDGFPISITQKAAKNPDALWFIDDGIDKVHARLAGSHIIAATPFLWANGELSGSVDYLFVDEAGQLSLIDTLAAAQGAKNLILLGDPQQLQQPQQGVHPEGTEVSALAHILGTQQTIIPDKGIFLDKTWRMHPAICAFVSEQFYDNKLRSKEKLELQSISGNTRYKGSGLRYILVQHEGNTNKSLEEVAYIDGIVRELVKGDVWYTNSDGQKHIISMADIKIISPYNAQVALLEKALPDIAIGTVDKFQGQEAPIVIYSVATSSPQEAPRGMDFLYSPHRFNVAVSRARALFILVASPAILEPDCKSPAQIKLANPLCRFVEMAEE